MNISLNGGYDPTTSKYSYSRLTPSSRNNPCPVCGRTKDGDCRISQNGELVLCHKNFGDTVPPGWRYVKPASDDRCGVFVRDYPKAERPWGQTFRHNYRSFKGSTHTQVREYKADRSGKSCRWEKPLGSIKEIDLLPYRWDEVKDKSEIFIAEGEMCVDDLRARGLPATCARKWHPNQAKLFEGKTAILLPDCDQEGLKKAHQTAQLLSEHGAIVKWCCLPLIGSWEYPKPNDGLDSYDYFKLGGTIEGLRAAISDSPPQLHQESRSEYQPPRSGKTAKLVMADELIALARDNPDVELWHTEDLDAYADITDGDKRQTFPIRDTSFRQWLRHQYYSRHRKSPNDVAITQALDTIEAFAIYDGGTNKVNFRVAEHEGKIYYDLGDESWRAVEISPEGWRVVSSPPVRFRRSKSTLPLPEPVEGGTLADLRQFMNLSDEDWVIVITYLINCLMPCSNYPVLILHGEAGTGKSTLSSLLKKLIDPSKALMMPSISDLRNLSIAAYNRHLLCYDNLSGISPDQSDALCRIATGASFSHRKLHTDLEETTLDFVRPQILNGIDALATRGDLLDRSILIRLQKPSKRIAPNQYWAEFERLHPQMLGALFSALSKALAVLPSIQINELPRMAEFAQLGIALERELGLSRGEFMGIQASIKEESHRIAVEASPIAQAIVHLMENRLAWKGYSRELLEELNRIETNETIKRSRYWPADATRLSKALTRLAPDLRALGIDINNDPQNKDRGGKKIYIEKILRTTSEYGDDTDYDDLPPPPPAKSDPIPPPPPAQPTHPRDRDANLRASTVAAPRQQPKSTWPLDCNGDTIEEGMAVCVADFEAVYKEEAERPLEQRTPEQALMKRWKVKFVTPKQVFAFTDYKDKTVNRAFTPAHLVISKNFA